MNPYRIEAKKNYEKRMAKVNAIEINNNPEYIARQREYGFPSDRTMKDYSELLAKAGKQNKLAEGTTACSYLLD